MFFYECQLSSYSKINVKMTKLHFMSHQSPAANIKFPNSVPSFILNTD